MELDDLASTESAVAAAAAATIFSPRLRGVLRRGAVYGVAGVMKAGDVVVGAARGAARGMRDGDDGEERAARPSAPRSTRRRAGS